MKQIMLLLLGFSCLSVLGQGGGESGQGGGLAGPGGDRLGQDAHYRLYNRRLEKTEGYVHLNEADGAGVAWLEGISFEKGALELEIRGRDLFQQSFVGIAFHGVNDTSYEAVYLRPFNFRSSDPVRRAHAVQYIQVPGNDWPVLRERFPGKYEQPLDPAPEAESWVKVRVELKEKVRVYINGKLALEVSPLGDLKGKGLGIWVGNGSAGDFRGLKISE